MQLFNAGAGIAVYEIEWTMLFTRTSVVVLLNVLRNIPPIASVLVLLFIAVGK